MAARKISSESIQADFLKLSIAEQRTLLADLTQILNTNGNPVTQLAELVQKNYGANMETEIWTEGASHAPLVHCKLVFPDGTQYTATARNQRLAKQAAAEQALATLQFS
jgi:dsRNA-specific ribonuclease